MEGNLLTTDRDYLEMLMHKLNVMKTHGQAFFARKQKTDERLYNDARRDLNEFVIVLRKRGYSGARFDKPQPRQGTLI